MCLATHNLYDTASGMMHFTAAVKRQGDFLFTQTLYVAKKQSIKDLGETHGFVSSCISIMEYDASRLVAVHIMHQARTVVVDGRSCML